MCGVVLVLVLVAFIAHPVVHIEPAPTTGRMHRYIRGSGRGRGHAQTMCGDHEHQRRIVWVTESAKAIAPAETVHLHRG